MSSRKRPHCKQYGVVPYESFRKSLIIHKEKAKEIDVEWVSFIPDKDTAKLYVQFFRSLAHCAVSLKCWFIWIRLWVTWPLTGRLRELKNKGKSSWVIPKVVAVAYESFSLQTLSRSSNVVSQRWSWLELVAYEIGRKESFDCIIGFWFMFTKIIILHNIECTGYCKGRYRLINVDQYYFTPEVFFKNFSW